MKTLEIEDEMISKKSNHIIKNVSIVAIKITMFLCIGSMLIYLMPEPIEFKKIILGSMALGWVLSGIMGVLVVRKKIKLSVLLIATVAFSVIAAFIYSLLLPKAPDLSYFSNVERQSFEMMHSSIKHMRVVCEAFMPLCVTMSFSFTITWISQAIFESYYGEEIW